MILAAGALIGSFSALSVEPLNETIVAHAGTPAGMPFQCSLC